MGSELTDWKVKALAQWNSINSMAARRFGEGPLAEEAALAVMDGLKTDDWRRIRSYKGKASFTTFVRSLTARLLEDFARQRFGRVRPPLWVKTFGGIWEKLFRALCLERLNVVEAVEIVVQRQVNSKLSEVEDAAYHLLARIPDCGKSQGLEVSYEDEKLQAQSEELIQSRSAEEKQVKELFYAIFQLLLGEKESEVPDSLLEKYKELTISLSPEEKLLLKLCYQDGMGVTQAGKMLGMSRFQIHGRMRRFMARLKAEFERVGLDQELRLLLQ
jgi:RNA polymerase sigma factor (sigma-70 family)